MLKILLYVGTGLNIFHTDIQYNIRELQHKLGIKNCKIYSQNTDEILEKIGCKVNNLYLKRYEYYDKRQVVLHDFDENVYKNLISDIVDLEENDIFMMIGIIDSLDYMLKPLKCKKIVINSITDKNNLDYILDKMSLLSLYKNDVNSNETIINESDNNKKIV